MRLRVGLDAARALAACYVVLHHVASARGWSYGPGVLLRFGQEAVMVFFLLSGFVIFANEKTRAASPRGYYLRRLRRIYPALIAAMLVSTLVAIDNRTFINDFRWRELLGTLASIQDVPVLKPGVIASPYLQNDPLWSLSYEVAFYIAFPFVLRLWLRHPLWATHSIGVAACAGYVGYMLVPNHWALVTAYFLVWWCGAMAAEAYSQGARDVRSLGASGCWLLLLATVAAAGVLITGYRGAGAYPFLMLRHFAASLIMLGVLFGPFGGWLASLFCRVSRPASAIAALSYGLYVLHYPLLVTWRRAQTGPGLTASILLLAALAYVADRQMNRFLPRAPSY
jgi:peptidoglycan/LPS O-acetylase OafA/YrhL